MVGRYQPPDVLRRADTLARPGPSAADVTVQPAQLTFADARNAAVASVCLERGDV